MIATLHRHRKLLFSGRRWRMRLVFWGGALARNQIQNRNISAISRVSGTDTAPFEPWKQPCLTIWINGIATLSRLYGRQAQI